MRPSLDLRTTAGFLALLGTLALLSPGVTAVRADADDNAADQAAAADGPTCEAGTLTGAEEITAYLQWIQELQLRQLAEDSEVSSEGYITLNNRGYNYGRPAVTDPALIAPETRR